MNLTVPSSRPLAPALTLGRRRLRILAGCFTVAFISIGVRLVDMGTGNKTVTAVAPPAQEVGPDARRADIVDRNGELLATNLRVPSIYADPSRIPNIEQAAVQLASVLSGTDAADLTRRFRASKHFAWIKHDITPVEQRAVLDLGVPGVGFELGEKRIYPRGPLAAQVVGFVDVDNQGLAGIEYGLQDRLVGGADAARAPVELSLDLRIQQIVREEVSAAARRFQTKGAAGVVMDQRTGELLSLVSLPDYDPNRGGEAPPEGRQNRVTGDTYELGSLFKLVSTAMVLESGKVTLRDGFDASQPLKIGRYTIHDDHPKHRKLSVPEIFMYSSNIGMAQMVFAAGGAEPLQAFFDKVGMLQRPQLELPELARPQIPKRWPDITTATASFGHGIAVTPLQFISAAAALGGDGTWIAPTILRRDPSQLPPRKRLISEQTARDMRLLMWLTVEKGTGVLVKTPGYLVGGKTGTADKVDPVHGGYLRGVVLASFCGVFPLDNPRYVVLVMLDEPHGDSGTYGMRYAGWTAGPVVREIISRIGPVLGVPPSTQAAAAQFEDRPDIAKLVDERAQLPEERVAAVVANH
jgi:cell division protein FtsI (penicillin-binding protein 3)